MCGFKISTKPLGGGVKREKKMPTLTQKISAGFGKGVVQQERKVRYQGDGEFKFEGTGGGC